MDYDLLIETAKTAHHDAFRADTLNRLLIEHLDSESSPVLWELSVSHPALPSAHVGIDKFLTKDELSQLVTTIAIRLRETADAELQEVKSMIDKEGAK